MRHLLALVLAAGCAGHGVPVPVRAPESSGACPTLALVSCHEPPPSFPEDIQPILRAHCLACHSGDGVAAEDHDFSHVETLWQQRLSAAGQIETCGMPPRKALPPADAVALLQWIACGSPDR
jgi:hypothetical protein